ncbi:MAG: PQQ-binding-like beta-propeller repeat protein [Planctomycetota bacterium]
MVGLLAPESLKAVFGFMAGQGVTGSLRVSDGTSEKLFFIRPGAVKLFSIGGRKRIMLGEVLILMGAVTKEQFDQALYLHKTTGLKLGAVLKEMGALNDATLTQGVENVVFEEVYDLLFWEGAAFRFTEQMAEPALEGTDLRHTELAIDSRQFLTEVAGKIDEIDVLRQWIPDSRVIFTLKRNVRREDCIAKVPGYSSRMIVDLIDGERSVDDICAQAKLSRYEVYRVISLYLSEGFIQEATMDGFRRRAEEHLAAGRGADALRMLACFTARGGDRAAVLQLLAQARELTGDKTAAAADLGEYGDQCFAAGRTAEGVGAFEKAITLWPDNIDLVVHYADILKRQGKTIEWAVQLERAGKLFEKAGSTDRAIETFRTVLQSFKSSPYAQRQLAKLTCGRLPPAEQAVCILCPVCETRSSRDTETCPGCGQKLYHACLACSKSIPVSDSACEHCHGSPHATADSSAILHHGDALLDENAVAEETRAPGEMTVEAFWQGKFAFYTKRAREHREALRFTAALRDLEMALLINPNDTGIKCDAEQIKVMAADQELAALSDRVMVAQHRRQWGAAVKACRELLRRVDPDHPHRADVNSLLGENQARSRRKLVVSGSVLAGLALIGIGLWVRQAVTQGRRAACIAAVRQAAAALTDRTPANYRAVLDGLKASEIEYSGDPDLRQLCATQWTETRRAYAMLAVRMIAEARAAGQAGKPEQAIAVLRGLREAFPDLTDTELAEINTIEGEVTAFQGQIEARDRFLAEQSAAREQAARVGAALAAGRINEAAGLAAAVQAALGRVPELFDAPERAAFETQAAAMDAAIAAVTAAAGETEAWIRGGRFEDARRRIGELRARYGTTDILAGIDRLAGFLDTTERFVAAEYEAAKELRGKGEFDAALQKLAALRTGFPALGIARNIAQLEQDIREYIDGAREAAARIEVLLAEGRVAEAHALTRTVLTRYPRAPESRRLALPVLVSSRPERTELRTLTGEKLGTAPCLVMVTPGTTREVVVARRGFLDRRVAIDGGQAEVVVPIEKTTIFPPVSLKEPVVAEPVITGSLVIIPNGTGLAAFNIETGAVIWEVPLYERRKVVPKFDGKGGEVFTGKTDFWELTGRPCLYRDEVVVGGRDGRIHFINPRTGSRNRVLPAAPAGGYGALAAGLCIQTIPVLRNEEIAFFSSLDRGLYAVPIGSGRPRWRTDLGTDVAGLPVVNDQGVWIGAGDGTLRLCDIAGGMVLSTFTVGTQPLVACLPAGDGILAVGRGGAITLFKPDGSVAWERVLADELPAAPVIEAGAVFCPGRTRGCTRLNLADGRAAWFAAEGMSAVTAPCVVAGQVFLGTEDRQICSLDAQTGGVRWKYGITHRAQAILSRGVNLIVITDAGTIYTFEIEQ